jgi:hypothetical protein
VDIADEKSANLLPAWGFDRHLVNGAARSTD